MKAKRGSILKMFFLFHCMGERVVFILHLSRFTYVGIISFTGKGKVRSQKAGNRLDSTMYINVADDSDTELLKIEQRKNSQVSIE